MTEEKKTRQNVWLCTIMAFIFLQASGGILYVFRPNTPLFLQSLGITSQYMELGVLPAWMIYNLPDGLYCLSFLLMIKAVWGVQHVYSLFFLSLFFVCCLLSEGFQYLGLLSGTYDILDIAAYALAAITARILDIQHLTLKHQNV